MILLDTDVVSGLRRPERAHPNLVRWASRNDLSELYLSAVTVLEIEVGVLQIERRDAKQGRVLRSWFEERILAGFADRILPLDLEAARRCAPLHVPNRRPDRDAMIAATAIARGIPVATRNTADFTPTGVHLVNPWETES